MLERFHVRPEDEVRVRHEDLRETVSAIFEAQGVPPEEAAEATDVLVTADLRGVETHGVSNMLRSYVASYRDGSMNPRPNLATVRERRGTATLDGDRGLGIVHGRRAMELAVTKARDVGMGVVSIRNSRHLGALGHFARIATEHDMVGMCMSAPRGIRGRVVPTFASLPRLGTNPLAFAAPAGHLPTFHFDVATSAVAGNKIRLARRLGAPMAPGWIAGEDGAPIMEPSPAPEGDVWQLPLGGNREQGSHKGYGLSLMVETLAGMLVGTPTMLLSETGEARHTFIAWDIAAFTDLDTYTTNMDDLLQAMLDTPPAPGHERVIYPGIPEHEAELERREIGIPLHPEVIEWFDGITGELGLAALRR
jgi:LDH2 family malate/lactate/ureidoglycolate dehydrogenase